MRLARGLGFCAFVSLGLLFVAAPGCGRVEVEDVCEALQDCASGEAADCTTDGEQLERASEEAGCEAQFDDYIECIYDAGCGWEGACAPEREQLERCVGEFPS